MYPRFLKRQKSYTLQEIWQGFARHLRQGFKYREMPFGVFRMSYIGRASDNKRPRELPLGQSCTGRLAKSYD